MKIALSMGNSVGDPMKAFLPILATILCASMAHAARLCALTYGSDGYPSLTTVAQARYTVTSQQRSFFFSNSNENRASDVHTMHIRNHKIEVVIPKKLGLEGVEDGLIDTVAELPLAGIESVTQVIVNPEPCTIKLRDNESADLIATAHAGGAINIYPVRLDDFAINNAEALRITRHEFGHQIARILYGGSTIPGEAYIQRTKQDKFLPSNYAAVSVAEDFAEAIEVYLRTNAGRLDPIFREELKNRFDFLDAIFSGRNPSSVQDEQKNSRKSDIIVRIVANRYLIAFSKQSHIGLLISL